MPKPVKIVRMICPRGCDFSDIIINIKPPPGMLPDQQEQFKNPKIIFKTCPKCGSNLVRNVERVKSRS
jgi:hypothetical protein